MLKKLLFLAALVYTVVGCNGFVQSSVSTLAAAQGVITQAQANHTSDCSAAPTGPLCLLINQAVAAQNAAISGLEAYCQLPVAPDAATLQAKGALVCNANPGAKAAFVSELNSLSTIIKNYQTQSGGK